MWMCQGIISHSKVCIYQPLKHNEMKKAQYLNLFLRLLCWKIGLAWPNSRYAICPIFGARPLPDLASVRGNLNSKARLLKFCTATQDNSSCPLFPRLLFVRFAVISFALIFIIDTSLLYPSNMMWATKSQNTKKLPKGKQIWQQFKEQVRQGKKPAYPRTR